MLKQLKRCNIIDIDINNCMSISFNAAAHS